MRYRIRPSWMFPRSCPTSMIDQNRYTIVPIFFPGYLTGHVVIEVILKVKSGNLVTYGEQPPTSIKLTKRVRYMPERQPRQGGNAFSDRMPDAEFGFWGYCVLEWNPNVPARRLRSLHRPHMTTDQKMAAPHALCEPLGQPHHDVDDDAFQTAHIGWPYFEEVNPRSFTALTFVGCHFFFGYYSKFHANVMVAQYLLHLLVLGVLDTIADAPSSLPPMRLLSLCFGGGDSMYLYT
ncbi:hypothetical protein EDB89DRAFT_1469990 [Lactarius sanguifluus]|nr:hypothetical protein EDB89DRAFT_1469990 [Lactarius sanguifluus]